MHMHDSVRLKDFKRHDRPHLTR